MLTNILIYCRGGNKHNISVTDEICDRKGSFSLIGFENDLPVYLEDGINRDEIHHFLRSRRVRQPGTSMDQRHQETEAVEHGC